MPLRINSTYTTDIRGLDAYWTCPKAIRSLIILEGKRLPLRIWLPAAGNGAIVRELVASGRQVSHRTSTTMVCPLPNLRLSHGTTDDRHRGYRYQSAVSEGYGIRFEGNLGSAVCCPAHKAKF